MTEHSPDGRVLMEAQFASKRFVSYRSYKFNFTSKPAEPPVVKAFVFGDEPKTSVSVYYVSWNGATDLASWSFFDAETGKLVGTKQREGFETTFTTSQVSPEMVYAQAAMKDGSWGRPSDAVAVQRSSSRHSTKLVQANVALTLQRSPNEEPGMEAGIQPAPQIQWSSDEL